MSYTSILYSVQGSVANISLNRPDVYNALDQSLCKELYEAFHEAGANESVRAVIFSGEGKGFCSGQDLKIIPSLGNVKLSEYMEKYYNPLVTKMRTIPQPIICRLHSVAAGAGASLVVASDLVIASREASLAFSFVNIGLVPDTGISYFLPRVTGRLKSFELLATGKKISAEEALQLGLINEVVDSSELDNRIQQVISFFTSAPSRSVALIKKMLNHSYETDLQGMLKVESEMQNIAGATEDFKEAVKAFGEKRKPVFKGK